MRAPRSTINACLSNQARTVQWQAVCLVALALLMTACDSAAEHPTSTPTHPVAVTSTPIGGLPPFSDWRVVYADVNGHLHAISTDGKNDVAGPTLVGLSPVYLGRPTISSTGQYLAYASTLGVSIIDLLGQQAPIAYRGFNPVIVPRGFAWSPDGTELAVDGDGDEKGIIHIPDLAIRRIPLIPNANLALIRWIDSNHIAGYYVRIIPPTPGPSPTEYSSGPQSEIQTVALGVEDLRTGSNKVVFSLTSNTLSAGELALSPDGHYALLYNGQSGGTPFRPDYRLIDIATGKWTALPHIMQTINSISPFSSVAWRPGTMTLAVSTGFDVNGDLHTWLLDVQHDTATALPYQTYVAGWTPDNGPLILTTGRASIGYKGPFTLSAVTDPGTPGAKETKLVDIAYHFNFGGFARTA